MFNKNLFKRLTVSTLRKVPEVTVCFWIVKLLTTAVGESTSDFLVHNINPYMAVVLGGIGFSASLALQLSTRRYVVWIYWLSVAMVAVFGTMAADVLHFMLGIPYFISAIVFAISLTIIFTLWYISEKTLSIHSIYTPRRELFYWATVMATFALGTATGDMTASNLGLGYLVSGLLFAFIIAIPALCYRLFDLNEVIAFWFAYIITRPIGASFADWFGRSKDLGGIGLGTGRVSIYLTIIIIFFIIYLSFLKRDIHKYQ